MQLYIDMDMVENIEKGELTTALDEELNDWENLITSNRYVQKMDSIFV